MINEVFKLELKVNKTDVNKIKLKFFLAFLLTPLLEAGYIFINYLLYY